MESTLESRVCLLKETAAFTVLNAQLYFLLTPTGCFFWISNPHLAALY